MIKRIKLKIQWFRFGEITSRVVGTVENVPAEVEYYDKNGKVIGFWAYGHFNPNYPYKG